MRQKVLQQMPAMPPPPEAAAQPPQATSSGSGSGRPACSLQPATAVAAGPPTAMAAAPSAQVEAHRLAILPPAAAAPQRAAPCSSSSSSSQPARAPAAWPNQTAAGRSLLASASAAALPVCAQPPALAPASRPPQMTLPAAGSSGLCAGGSGSGNPRKRTADDAWPADANCGPPGCTWRQLRPAAQHQHQQHQQHCPRPPAGLPASRPHQRPHQRPHWLLRWASSTHAIQQQALHHRQLPRSTLAAPRPNPSVDLARLGAASRSDTS
jgi:hypothetical protein